MRWYVDRAVIAGAYHSTELYWLSDSSEGSRETWRFLQRGLRDAENLRAGAANATHNIANVADAVSSTLSTLVRASRKSY
jgi:ubiquinone biosynthesis protein COQ9